MDQTPAPAEGRLAAEAPERTSHDVFSPIPVVGIGGSAGAIPALGRFLEGVTVPSGLVYVVILHLSADHESTLAELLQRHTTMPVVQVRESVDVECDTVYVIPPGRALGMRDDPRPSAACRPPQLAHPTSGEGARSNGCQARSRRLPQCVPCR